MAFGAISTLYLPESANAGSSQWGTNVRKLLASADSGTDTSTTTTHGTGGSTVRTDDPYTSQSSDLDQSLYGWAIAPSDMNSIAGAQRRYAAGNHVATTRLVSNSATTGSARITMYAYRVGNAAGGRVRTLLGSINSSVQSLGNSYLTFTATLSLSEVIFGVDETIQYAIETTCAGVAGGRTVTFATGTESGNAIRIATPVLETISSTGNAFLSLL